MSNWFVDNKRALGQAAAVFGLLFGLIVFLAYRYDFSIVDTKALLFIVSSLCSLLIAKNTFDEARAAEEIVVMSDKRVEDTLLPAGLYSELYKNSPVPYLVLTATGEIESANTAALRLFGLTTNRLLQRNAFELIAYEELGRIDLLIQKYRSGIAVSDELIRVIRADNREAWALLSLFRFERGTEVAAGLLTLVDITKQKRAEDAKSAFVSLASHQLRTPIAGMKWSVELLELDEEAGKLSSRQKKYVGRLLASIDRMARLVDDFLRVSRFELGSFTPEYERVVLSELCDEVIAEQGARALQKSLHITKQYDSSVDTILSDPNLLRMIITNLVNNAIKYTPMKGQVMVRFARQERALQLSVTDTGMGIPSSDQAQIFSKLFRASNATRDVPDGTGLGLYIVREAVSVLGGSISFTSTENLGTTFNVTLPLVVPEK